MTLRAIAAHEAATRLAELPARDPRGLDTAADLIAACQAGQCFALDGDDVDAVYVVHVRNGTAWIQAAAGSGSADLTALIDGVATAQAEGLQALGCQTARPGLVRKLTRRGWRVTGWVLRKNINETSD